MARPSADDTADCEVKLGDNVAYLGNPLPKRELTLNTNFTLFRYFRLGGVVDHRGGYKLYNATEQFRCVAFQTCQAAYDKTAPLADQAARMASLLGTRRRLRRGRLVREAARAVADAARA